MEKLKSYSEEDYFRSSSIPSDQLYSIGSQMNNLSLNESANKLPFVKKYSKNDFEVLELLGKGAYAKVVKAVHKETKQVKAIKVIDKTFMERVSIKILFIKIYFFYKSFESHN
jgi:serine/threonine protein kinase